MSKKVLPMNYPPVTSFAVIAVDIGIVINQKNGDHWFNGNFIQLYGSMRRKKLTIRNITY